MGLERIHLCTCSSLDFWLAGLAQNDVSKVGKYVLGFCDGW